MAVVALFLSCFTPCPLSDIFIWADILKDISFRFLRLLENHQNRLHQRKFADSLWKTSKWQLLLHKVALGKFLPSKSLEIEIEYVYRMRAIITRFWFETEDFWPKNWSICFFGAWIVYNNNCMICNISRSEKWGKMYKPRLIMVCVWYLYLTRSCPTKTISISSGLLLLLFVKILLTFSWS